MGILFVMIFYAIALTVAATIGAAILAPTTAYLTRSATTGRKRVITASALFPFACVAFAGAWFVCYATINYTVFHRDPGLGDTWQTPLHNGFALMMIDVTDEGIVYNPKTQHGFDSIVGQQDTLFGVRKLQVIGNRIFGARDSGYFGRIGQDSTVVDTYFELDTNRGIPFEFKTLDALRMHAAAEGVVLDLRDFYAVYRKYRFTWFDYVAYAFLLLMPMLGFVLLARWVWRIRQHGRFQLSETAPTLP